MHNIKTINIIILFSLIYLFYIDGSFWYTWKYQKIETIREIKDDLNELETKNTVLNIQVNETIKNAWELKWFFRDNLNEKELKDIKEIFDLYKIYSTRINEAFDKSVKKLEDSDESRQNLLKEKAGVYKRLTPYIKTEKLKDFLEFIKSDLTATKEKKDIEEDLYVKNNTLSKKVAIIKERIIQHKKALDEKLEKIIIKKVDEKIMKLKESPSFNKLSYELKKEALNNVILKIENKIDKLKENPSSLNNKKEELYEIVVSKLEELYDSLKK